MRLTKSITAHPGLSLAEDPLPAIPDGVLLSDNAAAVSELQRRSRVQVMEVFLIGCLGGVDVVGAGDLLSLTCGGIVNLTECGIRCAMTGNDRP